MEELVECIVKRRLTMKAYFGRCLSVALGILMVIITYVAALKVPYGIPVVLLFDLAAGFIIIQNGTSICFTNVCVTILYSFYYYIASGNIVKNKIHILSDKNIKVMYNKNKYLSFDSEYKICIYNKCTCRFCSTWV